MRFAVVCISALLVAEPAFPAGGDTVASKLLNCAPKTYEQALDCLDQSLTAEDKAALAKPGGPISQHHMGLGMWMRNNWGLWKQGELAVSMEKLGFLHPDDMSATILDGYAARLNGRSLSLAAKAAEYRAYWAKVGNDQGCPMPNPEDKDFAAKADAALKDCDERQAAEIKGKDK